MPFIFFLLNLEHTSQQGQSPLRGIKWKPPTFTCRRLLKITQRSWHCVYLLWDSGLGVTVTVVTVNFGIIFGLWLMCSSWRNWKNDNYDRSALPLATAGTQEMTVPNFALRNQLAHTESHNSSRTLYYGVIKSIFDRMSNLN